MKPKISVIMAVHNEPCKVLEESIRSILTQTYKNFELIICDDCSEKETLEFLKGVLLWDDRIKLLRNTQNLFAAATRNKGILASQGEYIAIADADDFSYPDRLQKEKDFLDNHPEYAFVSSKVKSYDGEKIVPSQFEVKEKPQKKDFLWGIPYINPAAMFRRECLISMGGYDESPVRRRTEDYDLFMRLYAAGYEGYNLETPLVRYFVNIEAMRKKRLYRYRIDEARTRYQNFKRMGLLPQGIPYVIKPLIVGLIPHCLIWKMKSFFARKSCKDGIYSKKN